DVGLRDGLPHGELERLELPEPLEVGIARVFALAGRLDLTSTVPGDGALLDGIGDVRGAFTGPSTADAVTGIAAPVRQPIATIELEAGLELPVTLPVCNAALSVPATRLRISGNGRIDGVVRDIVPQCDGSIGPFAFTFGSSELHFEAGVDAQRVELHATGSARFPGLVEGDSVAGSGSLVFGIDAQEKRG